MVHYMAIRVKCSIMIINAPFGEGDVSLSNSAHHSPFTIHFSPFTIHLSPYSMTRRWVEVASGVRRVRK